MLSRVQYLAKEEKKFIKKIEKTRFDALKINDIKQKKIFDLQNRIKVEQSGQDVLNQRVDNAKELREQRQA